MSKKLIVLVGTSTLLLIMLILTAGVVFLGKKQPVAAGSIHPTPTPVQTLDKQLMQACMDSVISFDKLTQAFGTERSRALETLNSRSAGERSMSRALDKFAGRVNAIRYSAQNLSPPGPMGEANIVFIEVLDQTKESLKNMSLGLLDGFDFAYEQGRLEFNEAGQTLGSALKTLTPGVRYQLCPAANFYS